MTDKPLEQVLEDFRNQLKQEQDTPWYSRLGNFFKKKPYLSAALSVTAGLGGILLAATQISDFYDKIKTNREAAVELNETASEIAKMRREINKSFADAAESIAGKHTGFEYSLIIYAKKTGGNTISYGESESEHENGNLCITGITEEQMREIVGERNYRHLKQNTDRGFTPVRYGREVDWEEAQEWTEITDVEAAEKLGKYCRQLENDLEYFTDNKIETGTFWKLKIRRHDKR